MSSQKLLRRVPLALIKGLNQKIIKAVYLNQFFGWRMSNEEQTEPNFIFKFLKTVKFVVRYLKIKIFKEDKLEC